MKQRIAGARFLARLAAVQALYQILMREDSLIHEVVNEFILHRWPEFVREHQTSPDVELFKLLVTYGQENQGMIQGAIQTTVKSDKAAERTELVLQCILTCATAELLSQPLTPTAVIVNEYVEVTKEFSSAKDTKFIHAALDRIGKHLRS